jgi:hypothetical protein
MLLTNPNEDNEMSISASVIVNSIPGVIGGGGNAIDLNGVILSQNQLIPTGQILSFSSADAVGSFFGISSEEFLAAQVYFEGYANSTKTPGQLYIAPFVESPVAAWLKSGSLAGMTLTQLQALAGTIILTVNGTQCTSSAINLSGIPSFSNAASEIQAAFTSPPFTVSWNAVQSAFVFTDSTTGAASTITYATGTLAAGLNLTQATGAMLSQGAVADTETTAMANVVANTRNWATFMTLWEPLIGSKEAFATWNNSQGDLYAYICWDTDAQAIVANATEPFGVFAKGLAYNGICCLTGSAADVAAQNTTLSSVLPLLAAFVMGYGASLDFSRLNGRATAMFRQQSGFLPTVTDATSYENLISNGYSCYGQFATANQQFNFLANGQITGKWLWLDSYLNQIYLNSQLQLALLTYMTSVGSMPYNEDGYSAVRAALADPIKGALNFGSMRTGISLSTSQMSQINTAAGNTNAANAVQQQGYFLQVLDPGAQARSNRQTPVINLWYTDGQSIQQISMASVAVL